MTSIAGECRCRWVNLTALVTVEYARHAYQVQGHAQLGICLDIQWLFSSQSRCETRRSILPTGEAGVGDIKELRRVGRRRKRIGVSNPGNVVLVDRAMLAGTARRQGHDERSANVAARKGEIGRQGRRKRQRLRAARMDAKAGKSFAGLMKYY